MCGGGTPWGTASKSNGISAHKTTWICFRSVVMSGESERTGTQFCLYTHKFMCVEGSAHFARKHNEKVNIRYIVMVA